ncbi:MAG: phage/plasmid primase, P4 family [Nitrospirales bacterium]
MKTSEASVHDDIDEDRLDGDTRGDDNAEEREPDTDVGADIEKVWVVRARGNVPCVRCGRSVQGQLVDWSQELNGAYHIECQNVNRDSSAQVKAPVSLDEIAAKVSADHDEPVTPVLTRQPEETPSIRRKGLEQKGLAPADRAEEYLIGRMYETPEGLRLRKHRGQWLRYTGTYYESMSEETFKVDITNYFNGTVYRSKVNPAFVSSVVQQLTARCLIPDTVVIPARDVDGQWIDEPKTLTFMNGTISMCAVQPGITSIGITPGLHCHSPKLVSRCLLPYEYLSTAQCPTWLGFLEEILPDEGSRNLLQQIFGYCLTQDMSLQKFFMFEGAGGNGKGVVTGILGRILGSKNISAVQLSRFHDGHEIVDTLGKLVNFMSELGEKDRTSEEQLKRATGEDLMFFNPKYQKPFSAKFTAKLIISTNERPAFADRSNGTWRRLILLPFPVNIAPEKQNAGLEEKLATELPGILNWAIQGAISLYRKGQFEEPPQSIAARLIYQKESNPARLFFDDCCKTGKGGLVMTRHCYEQYVLYVTGRGYKALNEGKFKKEVLRLPGVKEKRVLLNGTKRRVYRGITITNPEVIGEHEFGQL